MPLGKGERWPLKDESKRRHPIPSPSLPGSATRSCPLDLMDHSVVTTNLGDAGKENSHKGGRAVTPSCHRFHEVTFIVLKSSSLELHHGDSWRNS